MSNNIFTDNPFLKSTNVPETHKYGLISFEQEIKQGSMKGDFGIQIAEDGRIWICLNGQALIRFKPLKRKED